ELPRPRPGGRTLRATELPRTSTAHSRASSSTSQWSRKKPASPSSSISFSSSSRRLRARRLWPFASPYRSSKAVAQTRAHARGSALRGGGVPARGGRADPRLAGVGEVGVAVAEALGQVELEPLGELGGASHGV